MRLPQSLHPGRVQMSHPARVCVASGVGAPEHDLAWYSGLATLAMGESYPAHALITALGIFLYCGSLRER